MKEIKDLSRQDILDLLADASKNWLAHDGLWFRAVEHKYGIEAAMELDRKVWKKFTVIEAQRIMKRFGIKPGGGISALIQALKDESEFVRYSAAEALGKIKDERAVKSLNQALKDESENVRTAVERALEKIKMDE